MPVVSDIAAKIVRWRQDPELYVHTMFGAQPTEQQGRILRACARWGSHVTVRSGHGIGKTTVAMWLILWFLHCHRNCRAAATAPSAHQLSDQLWAEAHTWTQRMPEAWKHHPGLGFDINSDRIAIVGSETRFAVARTARADRPEAIAGRHAENMLIVVDEASGVPQQVYEAAEGSLSTRGARVLLIGNPTRTEGYFYESHTKKWEGWDVFHFRSGDSPLADPEWVERMRKRWGAQSGVYLVRCEGEFPPHGLDTIIPVGAVIEARQRGPEDVEATGLRIAGLDVARFGDDNNALVIRQGAVVQYVTRWGGLDTEETADKVEAEFALCGGWDAINIDEIGVGAGVVDKLRRRLKGKCQVNGVTVSLKSPDTRYPKLRDLLWFRARDWFRDQPVRIAPTGDIVDDLEAELTSVRYSFSPTTSQLVAESKDDMKKRVGNSPDVADAFIHTFAPLDVMGAGRATDVLAECVEDDE